MKIRAEYGYPLLKFLYKYADITGNQGNKLISQSCTAYSSCLSLVIQSEKYCQFRRKFSAGNGV